MLSAVAARKARLQGQTPSPTVQPPAPPASPSPAPATDRVLTPKPSSKRKPSEQATKPPSKRNKHTHTTRRAAEQDRRTRYFEEPDAFKQQDDVIIVDITDNDDNSDVSEDDESVSGLDRAQPGPQLPAAKQSEGAARGRVWSPSAPLQDSSEEEEIEMEGDAEEPLDVPALVQPVRPIPEAPSVLSTFRPAWDENIFHLSPLDMQDLGTSSHSEQPGILLVLSASEVLALLGTYTLTVLRGSVSLAGVTLAASRVSHRVFAPRSSPLPLIECLSSNTCLEGVSLPARLKNVASCKDTVILLQELHSGVEGLGNVCRTFDDVFSPSRWQKNITTFDLRLQGLHLVSHRMHGISPMQIPSSWEAAMGPVLQPVAETDYSRQVYLVKGPKNSGKSTFARTLFNRLLMRYCRVAFLECDLGQSEFTPGGMVSLNVVDSPVFGPSFTHPSLPHSAHYVGAATPRNSPSHYLDSVQALVQTYNVHIQHAGLVDDTYEVEFEDNDRVVDLIPLVVNTMGWTKGLGADLSRRLEELVDPSDVFDFSGAVSYGSGPHPSSQSRMHILEPMPSDALSNHFTPADHRMLSILSYFHAVFPAPAHASPLRAITASSWRTSLPLCAQLPYEVDCQVALDQIFLTGAGAEDVVPSEVPRVLNGAVVALVTCEPDSLDIEASDRSPSLSDALLYKQGVPPPSPFTSSCSGLALVRALAPAPASSMHLLTPLPPDSLTRARVLVKGELELPVWGMLDFRSGDGGDVAGVECGKVPYLRWGKGEGAGGDRRRVRRNLMRRGQM